MSREEKLARRELATLKRFDVFAEWLTADLYENFKRSVIDPKFLPLTSPHCTVLTRIMDALQGLTLIARGNLASTSSHMLP